MLYLLIVAFLIAVGASAESFADSFDFAAYNGLSKVHPELANYIVDAITDPERVAKEIRNSPAAQLVQNIPRSNAAPKASATGLPIVFAHGMGDSCFNGGMQQITQVSGQHMGVYSVCIPTGDTQSSDTMNGFFMTMDKNVDVFAAKIAADPKLANGFNAVGFSQGNSVIRGYIQRYNTPRVANYISVHGTVMGVAGFPKCNPDGLLGPVCKILDSLTGDLAYNSFMQGFLFQANYLRDPKLLNSTGYLTYSPLAKWNNEASPNATYTKNFESVDSYLMIRAMKDSMIYPSDGEHWGQFAPGQFVDIQTMKETSLYKNNNFGLQTVDAAGKIFFNTTDGDHLQFTEEQLFSWLDQRF